MTAVDRGDPDGVVGLQERRERPDGDYDQRTALHIAVSKGNTEMIRLLVENGADVIDAFGLSPLAEASRSGTRTGENKVRDLLISGRDDGGKKTDGKGSVDGESRLFVWVALCVQVLLVLFACVTKFSAPRTGGTTSRARVLRMYRTHVMIIVGFGF